MKRDKRILILDSSAFIHGFPIFQYDEECFTSPQVLDELTGITAKTLAEAALAAGKLKVLPPPQSFIDEASSKAKQLGDHLALSLTDLSVLGLAMYINAIFKEREVVLVSDDYSLQNVASKMGFTVISVRTRGITKIVEWVYYCPSCKTRYPIPPQDLKCELCGAKLKRRPLRIHANVS